jgi:DNA polymerase III alpha subunit
LASVTAQGLLGGRNLWRRAGVPSAAIVQLAEADAFRPSLRLARREALWAIKALFSAALMHALINRDGVFPSMASWKSSGRQNPPPE